MKRPAVIMEKCRVCLGAGEVPSGTTGALLRLERESRGVTRAALQPYFLKPDGSPYSEAHLLSLEHDVRAWSSVMVDSFRKAIERAVAKRLRKEAKVEVVI